MSQYVKRDLLPLEYHGGHGKIHAANPFVEPIVLFAWKYTALGRYPAVFDAVTSDADVEPNTAKKVSGKK